MKVNNGSGSFSRNGSVRSSSRRSIQSSHSHSSYSSPLPSPGPPKSPSIKYTIEPPHQQQQQQQKQQQRQDSQPDFFQAAANYGLKSPQKSPAIKYVTSSEPTFSRSGSKSPHNLSQRSHSPRGGSTTGNDVFDFNTTTGGGGEIYQSKVKSPRSPRYPSVEDHPMSPLIYSEANSPVGDFTLQSPPKSKQLVAAANTRRYHVRQQFQSSRTDSSSNSTKSSLEYKSTTKHPTGDYQDIEYKVCNSLDSDSQHSGIATGSEFQTCVGYRYISERRNARHAGPITERSTKSRTSFSTASTTSSTKPPCNIRTNPGYDDRYGSSKSINESSITSVSQGQGSEKALMQRCRKSTSDLTDLTDDVGGGCGGTTLTSLSRPSSPRRKGSVKGGGLAYLASRRGSRDSVASNMSNVSNEEDIGPLNFQNTVRGRQRRTSNFLELPVPDHVRPRVCSLPEKPYNPRLSDDLYRLRTFSITNKGGVVNCGDSIINRRSRSNTSVNSTASRASNVSGERSPFDGSCCGSGYHTVDSTPLGSPEEDLGDVPKYRVVMLGESGVGKTALVSQFMTSEYMNTYDASLDDEFGERTVSILLDGEESEMIFIDHPSSEMSVENSLSTYEPHACVVVYSIVARASFRTAEDILNYLWREGYTHENSVIVVGNKADLARSRVITTSEGKNLAVSRDCKFIETSSGIQHNVDELLVGILKQIRLRASREKQQKGSSNGGGGVSRGGGGGGGAITTSTSGGHHSHKENHKKLHGSKTSLSLNIAREILQKICMNDISKSKSCENLHVL